MSDEWQAGAELDAEVARRVFGIDVLGITACHPDPDWPGWYVDRDGGEQRPVFAPQSWEPDDKRYPCGCVEMSERSRAEFIARYPGGDVPNEEPVFGHVPSHLEVVDAYSTGIASAWAVVERLQQLGRWFELRDHEDRTHLPTWEAEFRGGERDGWARADTAPLAICGAALLAVGEAR